MFTNYTQNQDGSIAAITDLGNGVVEILIANPSDDDYGLFSEAFEIGANYRVVPPTVGPDATTMWATVRKNRNNLLVDTDWTQLPDVPLATKEAWATYRQALRDITDQPDPFNIVWPVPPG